MTAINAEQAKTLDELMAETGDPVTTAFLVFQTREGQWIALADYNDKNLIVDRMATPDDVVGGSAAIQTSMTAQQAAMTTAVLMEQRAQAIQKQYQEQQQAQQVAGLIDPTKLRNPRA